MVKLTKEEYFKLLSYSKLAEIHSDTFDNTDIEIRNKLTELVEIEVKRNLRFEQAKANLSKIPQPKTVLPGFIGGQ